jgi:hypothetical protein
MLRFTIRSLDQTQRRRRTRSVAVALVGTAALAAAGCGSTGDKPAAKQAQAATTTPSAASSREFRSQRYGFSVTLDGDWSEQDALHAWTGKQLEGTDSPDFANFNDQAGRTLVAGAAPVAKGMRLGEWRAAMVRAAPGVCTEASTARPTTLGGEPALAWTSVCREGDTVKVNKIATLHDGRGYMLLLPSRANSGSAKERRVFESIRRSFRFARP